MQEEEVIGKKKSKKALWLISFTDVMSLMLAFFVLLFSMKTPNQEKWSELSSVLEGEYGSYYAGSSFSGMEEQQDMSSDYMGRNFTLNYLEALIKNYLSKDQYFSNAAYFRSQQKLVLQLPISQLQTAEYEKSFSILASALAKMSNQVELFITLGQQSQWENAFGVAQDIAKIIKNSGYKQDINLSGYKISELDQQNLEGLAGYSVNLIVYDHLSSN